MSANTGGCAAPSDQIVTTLPYIDAGCFQNDSTEQSFLFTLTSTENTDLYTTSYATGGFAPILTLYTASGTELKSDNGCSMAATETCTDAYIADTLAAGSYRLVLTESGTPYGNEAMGNYTASGNPEQSANFLYYGDPTFSGGQWGDPGAMFLSPVDGSQLTDAYRVDITIQEPDLQAPTAPEPVTGLMGLSGLVITWAAVRRQRRNSR
jgi:hypothetical protein